MKNTVYIADETRHERTNPATAIGWYIYIQNRKEQRWWYLWRLGLFTGKRYKRRISTVHFVWPNLKNDELLWYILMRGRGPIWKAPQPSLWPVSNKKIKIKIKIKINPGAPSTNTDEKKMNTEKDIVVYVQMHILYTSVHPAAAVEPTAPGVQTGGDGSSSSSSSL